MHRLLLLLALIAAPAAAGLRATYAGADDKRLIVEVADNGDARIGEVGAADYGLWRGGDFYVVGQSGEGVSVVLIEDVAAAIDQVVPPIFGSVLRDATPRATALKIEAMGEATVAGRAGKRYAVRGLDPTRKDAAETYVVSTDPALKAIGAALEGYMNAAVLPSAALIGPPAAELVANTRAIFALGTPLSAGTRIRLVSIESVDVPASRTLLPARPITVEMLVAAMKAARP